MSRLLNQFLLLGSLALLNASLTFANVWPTPGVRWDWALSVECAAAILVLTVFHRHAARLVRAVVPSVWVVLMVGRYLDVSGPGLYGREFNLYWDAAHLVNVAGMLGRAVPASVLLLGSVAALAGMALVWWATRLAWGRVADALRHTPVRRALTATAALIVLAFAVETIGGGAAEAPFASPVSSAYLRQARYVLATASPGGAVRAVDEGKIMDGPLTALDGADVVLAFVEAYGVVTYDDPVLAQALSAPREALAGAVRDAGRAVVSTRITSPTFGASSWLAHLSLLTGVEVRDQYTYVGVMASTRDTLPRAFRRNGYRSVAVMPGMRQPWPEGAFYGYDHIYGRDALEYAGPRFGWWSIPDQFTLARLDALELNAADRAPRFVVFPTSTTHAPFGPVAPYQPDWRKVLGPGAFDPESVQQALAARPNLTNLSPSYARAMAYEITAFAGYVREHADDPMVLLLIGDHQPVAAVAGPGASHDVPLHVIASPGPLMDRLRAVGFVDGLHPPGPALAKMHALVPILFEAFR